MRVRAEHTLVRFGSCETADSKTVYFPDIDGADPQTVARWTWRATDLKHPVLKARYADLAWDMSRAIAKTKPDRDMARLAVNSYLECLATDRLEDIHDRFESAIRALDLSVSLRDSARIDRCRAALLALHRSVLEARQPLWWRAIDRLLDATNAGVTDEERAQLVKHLEDIAVFHSNVSDNAVFDPHATESAVNRLIAFYHRNARPDDVRRLQQLLGRTFEHFGSLGDAMVATSALQTAYNAYRSGGPKDDSNRVRIDMEGKIAESRNQMVPLMVERTITREDMEKFLESVVLGDLASTFGRLASEFLQNRQHLEQRVDGTLEQAPLMATFTHKLMAENHVAAVVGSVEDDPYGRLIMLAAQDMGFADVWLNEALRRTIEVHSLKPDHIVTWAGRKGLFDDLTFLREGVFAWYDGDFTKAVHVLVPQVERGPRGIVSSLGKPVTKPHPNVQGAGVAINMGDILYSKDITERLGADLTLHLLALYADPRGFNLCTLAHGLLAPAAIHIGTASRIIHTLLVLGVWEELAKARKKSADVGTV